MHRYSIRVQELAAFMTTCVFNPTINSGGQRRILISCYDQSCRPWLYLRSDWQPYNAIIGTYPGNYVDMGRDHNQKSISWWHVLEGIVYLLR